MEIVYRPMHLSDVENVWELLEILKLEKAAVSLADIPSQEELAKWLDNENMYFYIAEDGDQVLAILRALRGTDASTRHAVMLSAATHPDFRNQGIAKDLINSGLEDVKKDGVTLARAYIYSDNIPSINTVLRLGFTFAGSVHKHHYVERTKEFVDDLIFHKLL